MHERFKENILIVDDDLESLHYLIAVLKKNNYEVRAVRNGEQALATIEKKLPCLILLDINIPGLSGYDICKRLKDREETRAIPILFISGLLDTDAKQKGFSSGGVDYIIKPFCEEEVLSRVNVHLQNKSLIQNLQDKNIELQKTVNMLERCLKQYRITRDSLQEARSVLTKFSPREIEKWGITDFVGKSTKFMAMLEKIKKLQATSNTNVLLLGESGTGKEIIARAIHCGSKRKNKAFVAVNCSTINKEIADSLLFGHVRGAFTHAVKEHKGFFASAHRGTLFLDEIGDMSSETQTKILRVLEDKKIRPVGSNEEIDVDIRVIAATNKNIERLDSFRRDLYFRLANFVIDVPPLRERREDIPLFIEYFLETLAEDVEGKQTVSISPKAFDLLMNYHYPGNIRELKNIIEHALILCSDVITPMELRFIDNDTHGLSPEDHLILQYINTHGSINNNQCRELLGADMHHASYRLKKLHRCNILERKGRNRWSCYYLSE